jgi:hypothetical protein
MEDALNLYEHYIGKHGETKNFGSLEFSYGSNKTRCEREITFDLKVDDKISAPIPGWKANIGKRTFHQRQRQQYLQLLMRWIMFP